MKLKLMKRNIIYYPPNHLAWNVGNETSIRVGLDPWLGSGIQHILPPNIREHLEDQGILYLNQVADPSQTSLWRQGWMTGNMLGLLAQEIPEWDRFTQAL